MEAEEIKEVSYNKKFMVKSIICIVVTAIAFLIGIFTNALKHKFLIDSVVIYVIIILFLLFSIFCLVYSRLKELSKKLFDIFDIALFVGDALALFFIITTMLFSPIRISGDSMNDTLYDGDVILVSKMISLKQDNIVVFYLDDDTFEDLPKSYEERLDGELLIKRVVAVPGDEVKLIGNMLYVNDEIVETKCMAREFEKDLVNRRIPKGYMLVLGDNRTNSTDSREFGLVKTKNVIGYKITTKE